ncbi:MAG: hypothetical protein H0Z32_07380 [Bacillaceae bacterium]|nr:hypothetical protein [Bacillaceae bacterium]
MHKIQSHQEAYTLCQRYMNQYVLLETVHGEKIDGIIVGVDTDNVYLDVPIKDQAQTLRDGQERFWGWGPWGFPFSPYGYGFSRMILPLTLLAALSLPYFW